MTTRPWLLPLVAVILCGCDGGEPAKPRIDHLLGEVAGEVTADSVLLQSRLTESEVVDGDVPGMAGVARFEIDTDPAFPAPRRTEWMEAIEDDDFIVRAAVDGLMPGTRHYHRLVFGPNEADTTTGPTRSFSTLPGATASVPITFVAVSCMHYARFRTSDRGQGPDRELGFPALEAIRGLAPDFFVSTGDNVYYDHGPEVGTLPEMRKKWHEQLVLPRFVQLFGEVPTFWMKDDHDYRFDDADPFAPGDPSHELGVAVFREQAPVLPRGAPGETYRTHRVSRDLQLWFLEGRDHRDANADDPSADKTMWGETQRAWLEEGLASSDATFKIVVSPTPLVGPDDVFKRDNHTNPEGFRAEGEAFLAWAAAEGLNDTGLFLVVGDRHWQYHSVHPTGAHELGTGALVDGNARLGRAPGDPLSTDPDALVDQRYTSPVETGGFLLVELTPDPRASTATIRFEHHDEDGALLYEYAATRPVPGG